MWRRAYWRGGDGRAGVGLARCIRWGALLLAWAGLAPARAAAANGVPLDLPEPNGRRDGSGAPLGQPVHAVSGAVPVP